MGKPNIRPPQKQNPSSDCDKIWHGSFCRRDDTSCKISCKSLQGKLPGKWVKYTQPEIWDKAQRESARRPKSDWGKLEGGKEEREEFRWHQSHEARTQVHWHTSNTLCRLRVCQH